MQHRGLKVLSTHLYNNRVLRQGNRMTSPSTLESGYRTLQWRPKHLLSVLFLAVDVQEMLWTRQVEGEIANKITEIVG